MAKRSLKRLGKYDDINFENMIDDIKDIPIIFHQYVGKDVIVMDLTKPNCKFSLGWAECALRTIEPFFYEKTGIIVNYVLMARNLRPFVEDINKMIKELYPKNKLPVFPFGIYFTNRLNDNEYIIPAIERRAGNKWQLFEGSIKGEIIYDN